MEGKNSADTVKINAEPGTADPSKKVVAPAVDADDEEKSTVQEQAARSPGDVEGSEDGEATEKSPEDEMQARLDKYKWYKLNTDPATYDPSAYPAHYYLHADTSESSWSEPGEPYWLWDYATASADKNAGLQFPEASQAGEEQQSAQSSKESQAEWQGYNPKIHGNYDPNAPYAQYHKQLHAGGRAGAVLATTSSGNTYLYTSTMPLNRYTGQVQANPDFSADRHSDAAKSQRQLNAFFDADMAANMHGGKSLKEDRRNHKLTSDEIKAYNKARKEKKDKKRKAFLLS